MGARKVEGTAIGFTVKSGWASVVLVTASGSTPQIVDCRRIELSDPAVPDARQPYHAGFGTARDAGAELTRLVGSVKRFGRTSVSRVIQDHRASGHDVHAAG